MISGSEKSTPDSIGKAVIKPPVFCVDLDGTLVETDMLWECLALAIRQAPQALLFFPFNLLRGRAYAKAELAKRVASDFSHLPYRPEIIEMLDVERRQGAGVALV